MLQALKALEDLFCTVKFWTDSQVVYKWITNPELHLSRFVKRRIDKIILGSPPDSWHYVGTSINPADVGTGEKSFKNRDLLGLWLYGPEFLLQGSEDAKPVSSLSTVRAISVPGQLVGEDCSDDPLEKLIETSPNLYALKKRFAYLLAFKEFIAAKSKKIKFQKPKLDAAYLNFAFMSAVRFVQYQSFGAAISLLQKGTPDDYDQILKKLSRDVMNPNQMRKLNELKSLRNLRPCVDSDLMLRVEGRLENAELPVDTRHPFIIPSRHALTRLSVLNEHILAGHAGPLYTLMQTRQQFWIVFGNGSVKYYIADCGECALQRAKPVR